MLRDFLNQLIKPVKEVFINKSIKIENYDVHFLSIIQEKDKTKLWILSHSPFTRIINDTLPEINPLMHPNEFIKKDALLFQFERNSGVNLSFKSISIQNQNYKFNSSSSQSFIQPDFQAGAKFQFFIERDLIPERFLEYTPSQLSIMEYTLIPDGKHPIIDPKKEMHLEVETSPNYQAFWIEQDIKLTFKENFEQKLEINYGDHQSCGGYLYPLSLYDINAEMQKNIDTDKLKHLTDDQIIEFKELRIKSSLEICPADMSLLMMNYELEDGYSLDVYDKEELYIQQKVSNTATASFFMTSPEEKIGIHGLNNRITMLKAVAKNYKDDVEAEILILRKTIPGSCYSG